MRLKKVKVSDESLIETIDIDSSTDSELDETSYKIHSAGSSKLCNGERKECYEEILKAREKICITKQIPPSYIMTNSTISEIVEEMPILKSHLERVSGMDSKKISAYGDMILEITKKYIAKSA